MKKIVILFPGVRYSCDTLLLYYGGKVFARRGYEKAEISYPEALLSPAPLTDKIEMAKETVLHQLKSLHLEDYADIIFLSKSIGTALAGWAAAELPFPVRHIYLTPLEETLPYIDGEKDITVGAGEDEYLPAERLRTFCQANNIPVTIYEGVGHRLEDKNSSRRTLEILGEIVERYETF